MRTLIAAIALFSTCLQGQNVREVFSQAVDDFHDGRIAESVRGFDEVARLAPAQAPQLWQRGIALYYAGRFSDCRTQFESHRTVNPNDVENAAWHFLCVARASSPAAAKAALLPVGPDARVPMKEVYRMFQGAIKPQQVLAAARDDAEAQFYAHLYIGLFHEAMGNAKGAMEHLRIAAEDRFSMGGYMHSVARIHVQLRTRAKIDKHAPAG